MRVLAVLTCMSACVPAYESRECQLLRHQNLLIAEQNRLLTEQIVGLTNVNQTLIDQNKRLQTIILQRQGFQNAPAPLPTWGL